MQHAASKVGVLVGCPFDANGNLYGTAELGGASNQGTVWELAHVWGE
jgi:hypothetical protein